MSKWKRGGGPRPSKLFFSVGVGMLLLALLLSPLFPGGTSSPDAAGQDPAAVVGMTNTLKFTPPKVTVRVGETVRWKNTSVIVHTVTADPDEATMDGSVHLPEGAEPFDSGDLDPKEAFEHTFETPGTYTYFCIPHEAAKMRGTVVVKPKDG